MTRRNFSNSASVGVITTVLNNTDTSDTVTLTQSLTSWPATPCTAAINLGLADEEVVLVTSISGVNVTFNRGYNGSATRSHTTNATLTHVAIAADYDEANAHVNASTGVHGLTGAVVGTTDSQTLSFKTLTSPTIANFVLAQHDHSGTSQGGQVQQSSVSGLSAALAAKATDTAVVHTTGTETVGGDKTFTGAVTVNGNASTGGNQTVTGTLTVGGNASFNGPVTAVGGALNVTGNILTGGKQVWHIGNLQAGAYSGTTDASGFLTVTHGLGFTPGKIICQSTSPNAGANQGYPVVTAITATTFTIRYLPTAGSVNSIGVAGYFFGMI